MILSYDGYKKKNQAYLTYFDPTLGSCDIKGSSTIKKQNDTSWSMIKCLNNMISYASPG